MKAAPVPACLLCGGAGEPLFEGLKDEVYGTPGVWGLRRCGACGLAWLDPRPEPHELSALYERYFTHAVDELPRFPRSARARIKQAVLDSALWRAVSASPRFLRLAVRAVSHVPALGAIANPALRAIAAEPPGRVLDIGCGSGEFLAVMRALGWRCVGLEPDSKAAATARDRLGLEVVESRLEAGRLAPEAFDLVTLNHAIEHLADPLEGLAECRRLLAPGGLLAIVTPNLESLGLSRFGRRWVHLDVPRHFWLFTRDTLQKTLSRAGFSLEWLATGAGLAGMTAAADGRGLLRSFGFYVEEETRRTLGEPVGEELVAVARVPK